jgi:NAD+ kinase
LKRIGVVQHPDKPEAHEAHQALKELATTKGIEIVDASSEDAELIVALGGDGTILRAAGIAVSRSIPLLGVNVGRLGYLATTNAAGLNAALVAIGEGTFMIEERMTLHADIEGSSGESLVALNEIAIEKASPPRVIDVAVSVDSGDFATFTADGFLVATPTGSTAYSLSAGGPIVDPKLEAMILTAVSAHAPLWRSIVIDSRRVISLRAVRGDAVLTYDGREAMAITEEMTVTVRKNERSLRLVRLGEYDFFSRVRARFNIEPNA